MKDSYNERTESFPKQLDVKTSVPDVSDFSFDLKDFKEANKCFHGSNSSNINCNENYSSTNASSDSCLLNIKVDTVSFPSDSHMNTLITESESDNKEINTPEKTGISWKSEINDLGADKAEQQNIGEDLKHNSMILESDILKHCEFSKTQDSSNDFAKLENDKIPNEIYCTNFCNNIASTLEDKSGKTEVTNSLSEKLNNLSDIVPNFKIGSEITNVKFFHLEASKICHEIQKYQDSDMGCSLNSQMSVVSGSSFLDVGDHSLFDFTNDIEDFYESDNNGKEKIAKLPAFSGKKSVMITSNDNVSLPSLGSFKANPIDTIDLESSIISIASIASEIADINFNQNSENTFTITNKVCGAYDSLKEDHSSNLRSVDECFDEDNSLNCQENLPYDSEGSKDFSTTDSRKKMTPRERRKTFQDRYRTYTIRDLKSNIVTKANPGQEAIKFSSHGKNFIDGIKYFNPALGKKF